MKLSTTFALFILFISFAGSARQPVQKPALRKLIDSLAFVDQKVQQDFIASFKTGESQKFEKRQTDTFIRHTPILKDILNKYGYPNYDLVGKQGSTNYWLCVQHCDHDPAFQQRVLRLMSKEVNVKKANSENYAFLTDRVNINSGQPQIYGTQIEWVNDTAVPKKLKAPDTVNQRRAAVGLGTLDEYLAMMNKMHNEMKANH